MPRFTYTGETKDGAAVTETITADDRFAVYEIARKAGHTVASVNEAGGMSLRSFINVDKIEYYISRVKTDELVMVTRNLGSMLQAGLPLVRALSVIERQSTNPRLKAIMVTLRERINKGDSFGDALSEHTSTFSELYVAMVRAGEEGGTLSDTLMTLSEQLERSSTLKKKIKGAMMYPSIIITIMGIIGVLMMIYVVPSITATFRDLDVELPTTTKVLIAISDALVNNTLLVFAGMCMAVVALVMALRTKPGQRVFSFILLHLPVIGKMVKETNAARTSRTLSSLLNSGVDVIRALEITEDVVQNHYYKVVIREAAVRVEQGRPLSEIFIENEKLYPVLVGEMILVGEETGQISEMLLEMAGFYETEVEQKTKNLSTIIEPILMVVVGGGVGFFALAMIAPIYSITDSI